MIPRRLLYLDSHRLTAYRWQGGNLVPEGAFENGIDGFDRFADYLKSCGVCQYALLANVAEEGHALESIPYLRGTDRAALIARKVSQHFLGTSLSTAISLGYEKTRRKNEKLLISALTNPSYFEPWLQRLRACKAALSGIYSVAQLGGLLMKKLGFSPPRALLLTMQDQSIRESYLVDGRVHFSRMAPITHSSIAGIASSFSAEAGKLHQYLIGQRLIGRDETLPVLIVAHPLSLAAVRSACPDRPQLSFRVLGNDTLAEALKMRSPPEDSRCDRLFLQLLATQPPPEQFAAHEHLHGFRLSQIRQALLAFGILVLLASLLFSARELYKAREYEGAVAGLVVNERDLMARYQAMSGAIPQTGVDLDTLRRLTDGYGQLKRQQLLPGSALGNLGRVLESVPAISLIEVDWRITHTDPTRPESEVQEITTIQASLNLPSGSGPREALAMVDLFADSLRRNPDQQVRITQPPVRMESSSPLRGGDSEIEAAQPTAFSLEVTRRLKP